MNTRNKIKMTCLFFSILLILLNSLIFSQESTLLPESLLEEIIHEVSGEKAWWHVNELVLHHRIQPSHEYHKAALYVEGKAKEYGLKNVIIEKYVADGKKMNFTFRTRPAWDAEKAELWIIQPVKKKIADFSEIPVSLAVYSRDFNGTGDLIDVGIGESDKDYEGKTVKGKMVLASGHPDAVQKLAVFRRGALGVLSYYTIGWQNTRQPGDFPDQVTWGRITPKNEKGQKSTFTFMLPYRTGIMLKNKLAGGENVKLKAEVKAKVYAGHYEIVDAKIPGTKHPGQELVFIAHLDHYSPGANDNASGSAVLLEIARTMNELIKNKRIEPPLRTIRFLWVPEINGTIPYLANHPEAFKKMFGVINMDMVGANQKKAKAIFHLTRSPYSLPSYFDDVLQNFTEYARDINRENFGRDRSLSIIAPTGTRDNFDVNIGKYSGGSDHYIFVDGAIRIPAIMFGTWPDVYYHSSDDTPDKVDPTTLKRATFLGVAPAIYFGQLNEDDTPKLTMETVTKGKARIASDEKRAYDLLGGCKTDNLPGNYKEAKNIIFQAYQREAEAVLSCSYFAAENKKILKYLKNVSTDILKEEVTAQKRLSDYYGYLCSKAGIKTVILKTTTTEERLGKIIPKRAEKYKGPLDGNFLKLKLGDEFKPGQLLIFKEIPKGKPAYNNIPFETLNFVDGKRSITEIRNAVSAEYCAVSLEAVEEYLRVLAKAGVVEMK